MAGGLAPIRQRSRRRYPDVDLSVKLRVAHLVESVDFEPHELPPAATLIVRRFADPMPGCLRSDASALIPAPAWERAARSGLAGLARRAARPARDAVPSNANAVLFADEAELLACFSRDLLRGDASSLWWWVTYLRSPPSPVSLSLVETWRRKVNFIPSALAYLAARGEAERVLNAFSPAQAWTLLEEVARAFEIPSLCAVLRLPRWSLPRSISLGSGAEESSNENVVDGSPAFGGPAHVEPPWRDVLAANSVPPRLGLERMALLGVCLALNRAPAIVRRRRFAETLSQWHRSQVTEGVRGTVRPDFAGPNSIRPDAEVFVAPPAGGQRSNGTEPQSDSDARADGGKAKSFVVQRESVERKGEIDSRTGGQLAASTFADGALDGQSEGPEMQVQAGGAAQEEYGTHNGLKAAIEAAGRSDQALPAVSTESTREQLGSQRGTVDAVERNSEILRQIDTGAGVSTELGGILFLVNLLKALRLPDSLEEACGCELALGSWELVELIARCLLGSGQSSFSMDPVWTVLAALDQRSPEQNAGGSFAPAKCYRIPAGWIPDSEATQAKRPFAIRLRGCQYECWHGMGFPCVVRRYDEPPSRTQIEREVQGSLGQAPCVFVRRHPRTWTIGRLLGLVPEPPLWRFLAFLLPFIRWRLAAAMGLKTGKGPVLSKTVLLRTGRIWVTSTHVDLVMDLSQASGPVRLAGLDADPGWVPALGRVVKFHFR